MKNLLIALSIPLLSALIWCGCSAFPTKTEKALFTIQTNNVPVATNYAVVANPDGTLSTNPIIITGEKYAYLPGTGERQITQIGTETGNIFGVGGLVGTALGALFGAWRWIRSSKADTVSGTLAQEIEMVREFVKQLPNGTVYDSELVNWIQQHQAQAGVLQSVITILKDKVSNPEAKGTASEIIEAIESLTKKSIDS